MSQAQIQRRQALDDASDEDEDEDEDEGSEDEGEGEGGEVAEEEADEEDENEAMTDDQGTVSGVVLFTKEHADRLEERAEYGEKLVRMLKAAGAVGSIHMDDFYL